jgi:hypothetical protein
MYSIQAQAVRVVSASVILAAQILSSEAGASQVFLNLAPVVGGQVRVSEDSSMTFADAVEGKSGGFLGSPDTNSFWVGFQIPTELQYSLSGVNISGGSAASIRVPSGGFSFNGASIDVFFHGVANPAALPAIGETWSGFPSDTHHIAQLASELANGIEYGAFRRAVSSSTGFSDFFTVPGIGRWSQTSSPERVASSTWQLSAKLPLTPRCFWTFRACPYSCPPTTRM